MKTYTALYKLIDYYYGTSWWSKYGTPGMFLVDPSRKPSSSLAINITNYLRGGYAKALDQITNESLEQFAYQIGFDDGSGNNYSDLGFQDEKDLLAFFYVYGLEEMKQYKDSPLYSSDLQTIIYKKPWGSFDRQQEFSKRIYPLLQKYFANFYADPSIDLVNRNIVKTWFESQSESALSEKMKDISDKIRDRVNFSSIISIGAGGEKFRYVAGALTGLDVDIDIFISALRNAKFGIAKNDYVFEAFGLSEFINKEMSSFSSKEASILGLENAKTQDPTWYQEAAAKYLNIPEPLPEDLMNLRQCALITGLLHTPGSLSVNMKDYINDSSYNSPLALGGGGHERIYPVGSGIKDFNPNEFVNLCTIDPNLKDVLNSNDSLKPDKMDKFLYWVYQTSGTQELREANIPLTSVNALAEERKELRKLRQVINAYSTFSSSDVDAVVEGIYGTSISQQTAQTKFDETSNKIKNLLKEDANNGIFYFLKETSVKFEGTNPSTARSDVQVTLTFELSSIAGLETVLVTLNGVDDGLPANTTVEIRMMDLITISSTNSTSTSDGAGSYLSNNYSPNYSRLRLKLAPSDNNSNILVVDIATIDHQISRDSITGKTTLTINYRGYFETVMSMPFNDALADDAIMQNRWDRQQKALDVLKQENCKTSTVREALRIEQQILSREARASSFTSIISRLNQLKCIHEYTLDTSFQTSTYGNVLDSRTNFVKSTSAGKVDPNTDTATTELKTELEKKDESYWYFWTKEKGKQTTLQIAESNSSIGILKNKFFFLGDLMHVVSDCLYKSGTADHQDWVKNLNMRFIVSTINVPDPNSLNGSPLEINPICIPIDLLFFVEWFNSVVVNKNLSYYPIGIFMRDLIERLVNGIIYDTCFSLLLPDETPAQLRMGFFINDQTQWFVKNSYGWFNPLNPFLNPPTPTPKKELLFKRSLKPNKPAGGSNSTIIDSTNYCVFYQNFPSFMSQLNASRNKSLINNDYTISLFYGIKNVEHNFLSNVSFSKTNSPYLREARYFNNSYGNLSLLSNVYDLSFSFSRRKANTFFFPGNIINFYLLDWGKNWSKDDFPWNKKNDEEFGQSNPHKDGTISNILGMGGFFTVLSVEYILGETPAEFEIKISTKFSGTDAVKNPPNVSTSTTITDRQACVDAFKIIATRANELYETGDEVYALATVDPNPPPPPQPPPAKTSAQATANPNTASFSDIVDAATTGWTQGVVPTSSAGPIKTVKNATDPAYGEIWSAINQTTVTGSVVYKTDGTYTYAIERPSSGNLTIKIYK